MVRFSIMTNSKGKDKLKGKVTPKKKRKTWAIKPVSKVHDEPGYKRQQSKKELKEQENEE